MRIRILAVGKLKERFWKEAVAEYAKRLGAYAQVEVVEIPDRDPARAGGIEQARKLEGEDIAKALGTSYGIALAIEGTQRSSEGLAAHLEELMVSGVSDFAFIIGGSTGIDKTVKSRANELLSFGPITLPHNIARVVLVEQVYRAFKIMRNEPYHK